MTRPDEAAGWKWSAPGKLDGGKAQDAASALYSMQLADVAAGVSNADAGLDKPVVARAQTFDGWAYELRIGKPAPEDRYHVRASVSGTVPEKRESRADEKAEDKEKADKAFTERQAALKAKLEREQALGAFIVLLPKSTVEPLLRERTALVAVEKKDEKGRKKYRRSRWRHNCRFEGEPLPGRVFILSSRRCCSLPCPEPLPRRARVARQGPRLARRERPREDARGAATGP